MRPIQLAASLLAAGLFAVASAAGDPPARPTPTPQWAQNVTTCPAARPQVCTEVEQPVCATKRDGTRQSYGNGCKACADANVVSHVPAPCR